MACHGSLPALTRGQNHQLCCVPSLNFIEFISDCICFPAWTDGLDQAPWICAWHLPSASAVLLMGCYWRWRVRHTLCSCLPFSCFYVHFFHVMLDFQWLFLLNPNPLCIINVFTSNSSSWNAVKSLVKMEGSWSCVFWFKGHEEGTKCLHSLLTAL